MTSFVIQLQQKIQQFLDRYDCSHLTFSIEKNKKTKFGDFATNVLLLMRQHYKQIHKPFDMTIIKDELCNYLVCENIASLNYVEPGFLNITCNPSVLNDISYGVLQKGSDFGKQPSKDFRYYLELVSANPTGFLHIGHARNGVFGDTLANLLEYAGYLVYREYLINNVGTQIQNLAYALYVRYVNLCGVSLELPQDSYHGQDIVLCAKKFFSKYQDQFVHVSICNNGFVNLEDQELFANFAIDFFLQQIKTNLDQYQISIDCWFSEKSMHQKGLLPYVFNKIRHDLYTQDNALWFAASKYGSNNKNEVLIKSDQITPTYFAQDICYHYWKLRKFDLNKTKLINIFGADHHGHVGRLLSFVKAVGYEPDKITFLITQLIRLMRNKQEVKMSKRTGNSLTMQQMYEMVGYNALRWYLVSQSINTHIDIDLDQIDQHDATNPIYYVLYAYARIWQILLKNSNFHQPVVVFHHLKHELEKKIINHLLMFEPTIISAANTFEVHRICNYLYELAQILHSYYATVNILQTTNLVLQNERLSLIYLVQQIIFNGLSILKITPQKSM